LPSPSRDGLFARADFQEETGWILNLAASRPGHFQNGNKFKIAQSPAATGGKLLGFGGASYQSPVLTPHSRLGVLLADA
jgi:hypothetical protein